MTNAHDATLLDVTVHTLNGVVILEFERPAHVPGTDGVREHDDYRLVRTTIARIEQATTLKDYCDTIARKVRMLTGFDRVMQQPALTHLRSHLKC